MVALLLAMWVPSAQAGTLLFQVPSLTGDSTTAGYAGAEGWFNADSVGMGTSRGSSVPGSGQSGPGQPVFSPVSITRSQSIGSADLWMQSINGESLPSVQVVHLGDDGSLVWRIELSQAHVSGFTTQSGELAAPVETLSLQFGRVRIHQAGGVASSHCWDVTSRMPC